MFLIKPNKAGDLGARPSASKEADKEGKEEQEEEEKPKPFSLFDLKGNSKAKEEAKRFMEKGPSPVDRQKESTPPPQGEGTKPVNLFASFKPFPNRPKVRSEEDKEKPEEKAAPKFVFNWAPADQKKDEKRDDEKDQDKKEDKDEEKKEEKGSEPAKQEFHFNPYAKYHPEEQNRGESIFAGKDKKFPQFAPGAFG